MLYFNKLSQIISGRYSSLFVCVCCSTVSAVIALALYGSDVSAKESFSADLIENLAVRTLTLVDNNNKVRAQIGITQNGTVSFSLFDDKHVQRLALNADDNHSIIDLFGNNGNRRITLLASNSGYNGIQINDYKDRVVCSAATSKDKPFLIALTDKNKRLRHAMGFDDNKTAYIMTGPSGDEANMIFMEKDGTRGFSLSRRRSGGPIAVLGMNGDKPSLVMHDGDKSGLAVGYSASGEAGMLINQDGRPIWKAGAGSIRQTTPSIVDLIK